MGAAVWVLARGGWKTTTRVRLTGRGIILASVDANFLNRAAMGGLDDKENDARGWLLLEHLQFWKAWNQTHRT